MSIEKMALGLIRPERTPVVIAPSFPLSVAIISAPLQ